MLLLDEPFFGRLLSGLVKRCDRSTPELATKPGATLHFQLLVNDLNWPSDMAQANANVILGRLKHQLLHLLLRHPFLCTASPLSPHFDLAADLEVDQLLPSSQKQFTQLPHYLQSKQLRAWGDWLRVLDRHADKEDIQNLKLLHQEKLSEHQSWSVIAQLSSAEQKILDRNTRRWLDTALNSLNLAHNWVMPDALKHYLQAWRSPTATLSWPRLLKQFAGRSRARRHRLSMHRFSKRYPGNLGLKKETRQRLLIVLDTSGSISSSNLKAFFQEVHQIWRQGAELIIVECDDQVRRKYTYMGKQPEFVKGRGQTDFEAALRLLDSLRAIDGLIYFTDGHSQAPQKQSSIPVLWVISSEGILASHPNWQQLQGQKVKMLNF